MRKCRQLLAIVLILAWMAPSALACLPNPQMTQAEMACCKKMAGDCHMGAGQHPCCKTVTNAPSSIPSVQPKAQFHPNVAVVAVLPTFEVSAVSESELTLAHLGLPPPAPPGPVSVLRI
jgi:hypothetical protein